MIWKTWCTRRQTDYATFANFVYGPTEPAGTYGVAFELNTSSENDTDTAAIADGKVAATVLDVSRTPPSDQADSIATLVEGLNP
ncbi:hypothetical protein DK926_22240 [Rhodococcus sp. Eu-32]|uniref:hypothetical protein n=1 Tax=Rhodococcus sp. Eu-32 TaxID=1017319 RepID=UPI000F79EF41|nr:hypothetical protein [Rhodococcus sp. Eu-32]RRQ25643.1 hypothetical protein DK926_22240 [Rhodococcus sp. Eu-32]